MNEHHRRPLFIVSLIYDLLPLIFDSHRDSGHAGTKVARYYGTKKKIYVGSPRISRSFNFVENIYIYITYLEWRLALVFPSNLIEQREQIRSGIKKFRLMGDDRRLSRDDVRVVAYTRRVAYQPTCRACKSNGLWSNNSALCTATRHQAKANTRFTARLYFRKLPFPPTTFPLPSFESNEKITLNTSRKSFSQCLLNRAKYLTD